MARSATVALGAALLAGSGCSRSALPDPRVTAAAYASAVARGDAPAVYSMLTDEAQRAFGVDGTGRLLRDAKSEIAEQARSAASPRATVRAVADVPYADGEHAVLDLDGGRFRVTAAAGLPAGARTPAEALGELRSALSQRSYAALVRVLSTETRGAIELDMKSLVSGLEHADSLDVKVHGETAEVEIPGGHKVILKREAGVWRVQDFD